MLTASLVLILASFAATSDAIIVSGLLLKAFCELSQHLSRSGKDPLSIGKTLFQMNDPMENYLFEAIAKSYECAAKGSVYNIVDTTNTMLVIVDVPDWATSNACQPGPGPVPESMRIDKNFCNLIEFPNFIDPFDESQVRTFLKNFQHQVTSLVSNTGLNSTMQLNQV